ncbi:MAG: GNAT family N-acetyltransferase [Vicinamibacteria bacterium]|nr:GNAT family N-acetyltransferase [Vicinamibacteria bacterium]
MRPTDRIRLCEAEDRADVLALLASCGLPTDGLADHWGSTWVAVGPGSRPQVNGSVALEFHGQAALLRSLATRPDARGLGLGQALFEFALARAADRGVESVALLTTTAEPFFARRGFEKVSRDDLPGALQASAEFRGACPASAAAMILRSSRLAARVLKQCPAISTRSVTRPSTSPSGRSSANSEWTLSAGRRRSPRRPWPGRCPLISSSTRRATRSCSRCALRRIPKPRPLTPGSGRIASRSGPAS